MPRKSTKASRPSFRLCAGRSGHEIKVIYRHIIIYCLLCSTQGRLCTTFMFVTCLSGYETLALVVVMKNTEVLGLPCSIVAKSNVSYEFVKPPPSSSLLVSQSTSIVSYYTALRCYRIHIPSSSRYIYSLAFTSYRSRPFFIVFERSWRFYNFYEITALLDTHEDTFDIHGYECKTKVILCLFIV